MNKDISASFELTIYGKSGKPNFKKTNFDSGCRC